MIETNLDYIAQKSAFRYIHPGTKLFLALGSLVLCLLSSSPAVPFISALVISLVLIIPGKLSPGLYLKILMGPAFFVFMSIIVLLFMLGGGDVIWEFHPVSWIHLTVTSGAVEQCTLILCRVLGCSVSLFFITLTTPITDLFTGMKRLGIPIELIDLMMIVYRYIFIFYALATEIWQAQVMRLGYHRPGEAVRSFSMLCGMLFISSWNAGEDLIRAMDCRCYDGIFPVLDAPEPVKIRTFAPVLVYIVSLSAMVWITHPWNGVVS